MNSVITTKTLKIIKDYFESVFAKKNSLSTVATSGDYNDLINKPNISGGSAGGGGL